MNELQSAGYKAFIEQIGGGRHLVVESTLPGSREIPTKIRFTPGMPIEIKLAVEPLFMKWDFLIPSWCHEVNITWKDDDLNGALNVSVHYEYRRADVTVCPNFMSIHHRREQNVVHELFHLMTAPMANTARDLRNVISRDRPEMLAWADEMIRHSDESVTCDLQAMAFEFFNRPLE